MGTNALKQALDNHLDFEQVRAKNPAFARACYRTVSRSLETLMRGCGKTLVAHRVLKAGLDAPCCVHNEHSS